MRNDKKMLSIKKNVENVLVNNIKRKKNQF